jgi:hypothetical protein
VTAFATELYPKVGERVAAKHRMLWRPTWHREHLAADVLALEHGGTLDTKIFFFA